MLQALRDGSFLTGDRLRIYPRLLIVFYLLSIGWLVGTSHGLLDSFDRPLGTDFSEVYAAGVFVREGQPAIPYDNVAHAQKQRDIIGAKTPFYAWGYPPYFLALAALFASVPYLWALGLWQAAGLGFYLAAIARIRPGREALWIAAGFPAVYVNVMHGHNGFLTAGLFAFAILAVDRRPWLAGILFGLLAYKPQFGVLIPLALLAGWRWRAIASASLTVLVMTGATIAAFGLASWQGFIESSRFSREVLVEQGNTGFEKIQTVFSAVRMLGGSVALAYGFQFASLAICAAIVLVLWRRGMDRRLAGAALMAGAMLSTPYALDYDMLLLGPAIAMLAAYGFERGFRPFDASLLAFAWVSPLAARTIAGVTHLPIGVLAIAAVMGVAVRQARADRTTRTTPEPRPALPQHTA